MKRSAGSTHDYDNDTPPFPACNTMSTRVTSRPRGGLYNLCHHAATPCVRTITKIRKKKHARSVVTRGVTKIPWGRGVSNNYDTLPARSISYSELAYVNLRGAKTVLSTAPKGGYYFPSRDYEIEFRFPTDGRSELTASLPLSDASGLRCSLSLSRSRSHCVLFVRF